MREERELKIGNSRKVKASDADVGVCAVYDLLFVDGRDIVVAERGCQP